MRNSEYAINMVLIHCNSLFTFFWAVICHDFSSLQAQTSTVQSRLAPLCFVSTSQALMPAWTASPLLFSWRTDGPRSGRSSPLRSWGTHAQPCRRSSASSQSVLGTTWITGCWSAWLWKTVGWWDVSTKTLTPVPCSKGKSLICALCLRQFNRYVSIIFLSSHAILSY